MPAGVPSSRLLGSSIVVTGTHYSMTTLAGRLLAAGGEFHLLHEPTNPRPTLSYDSIQPPRWYEYYDVARYSELHRFLEQAIGAGDLGGQIAARASSVRSLRDAMRVMRYVQRKLPMRLAPAPAILKDPFLAFSARTLQAEHGVKVVLTVRHPCAFAESFVRAGHDFDFNNLMQPALLQALPDEAGTISRLARLPSPIAEQAAHLWRIVYGFAAQFLLPDPRTFLLPQDRLVSQTQDTVDALFAFAGAAQSPAVKTFLARNLQSAGTDFSGSASYIRRDSEAVLDKWRTRFGAADRDLVRELTGSIAEQLDYGEESWHISGEPR